MRKPITRRTVLSRRDAMSPEARAAASEQIARATAALIEALPAGSTVALYAPKGSEVDTARIDRETRARGIAIAYPRIVEGERRLSFHAAAIDELEPGTFGLREPRADAPAIAADALAVIVIPGLAFDRRGGRIGWGRGYYDATLVSAPAAVRIGLAFECQLVDEVPRDPHDVRLHYVVTEAAVHRGPD
jgi:5-formyltetrahydrofolate cyclo-ligase